MATTKRVYKGKTYVTHLLRRSIRKGKTVTHETLGNLSHLADHLIEIIKRCLKGETFIPAAEAFRTTRSLPHGHVDAVLTMIRKLGLEELIASEASPQRDLVIAMIAERLLFPCSKLAHTRHWHSTTLAEELDVAFATEDHLYEAMDWLLKWQGAIEKKLARRHLGEGAMVLYDVSSSYYEGKTCPLARFGHDRDGKTGCPIIVYGVLTDADGRPVAVQVYPGNSGDPKTVPDQVETLTKRFGLSRLLLVGDRGMLTQTQINVLKKHPGLGWISALRSGSIRRLLDDGHLIRKDLEVECLAEIISPEFPDERLVACYNSQLAEQRRRKRQELLAATQADLEELAASVARPTGQPETAAKIGVRAGKIINHYKVAKHLTLTIRDGNLGWARKEGAIQKEELLDGIYVIRTSEPAERVESHPYLFSRVWAGEKPFKLSMMPEISGFRWSLPRSGRCGPGVARFEPWKGTSRGVVFAELRAAKNQSLIWKMASISTAMPPGKAPMPTALRVPMPASPKTSFMRSEKPLITLGWSPKSGVQLTIPRLLISRAT